MTPSRDCCGPPGDWGVVGTRYAWNGGYWGPQVGFYGGINYGFGYFGEGFEGGYWRHGDFFYNRSVANVSNVNITNVYNRNVSNNFNGNRASFNGMNGVPAAPTHGDLLVARQPHYGPTAPQRTQAVSAVTLPSSRASINRGGPPIAATQRPGAFHGSGVVPTNGAQGSTAPMHGNRLQSSPTAEPPFASGQHGSQEPRNAHGQNAYLTARSYQTSHGTYPMRAATRRRARFSRIRRPTITRRRAMFRPIRLRTITRRRTSEQRLAAHDRLARTVLSVRRPIAPGQHPAGRESR